MYDPSNQENSYDALWSNEAYTPSQTRTVDFRENGIANKPTLDVHHLGAPIANFEEGSITGAETPSASEREPESDTDKTPIYELPRERKPFAIPPSPVDPIGQQFPHLPEAATVFGGTSGGEAKDLQEEEAKRSLLIQQESESFDMEMDEGTLLPERPAPPRPQKKHPPSLPPSSWHPPPHPTFIPVGQGSEDPEFTQLRKQYEIQSTTRPRSTTPVSMCALDDYISTVEESGITTKPPPEDNKQMKIKLPPDSMVTAPHNRVRRRSSMSWSDFYESMQQQIPPQMAGGRMSGRSTPDPPDIFDQNPDYQGKAPPPPVIHRRISMEWEVFQDEMHPIGTSEPQEPKPPSPPAAGTMNAGMPEPASFMNEQTEQRALGDGAGEQSLQQTSYQDSGYSYATAEDYSLGEQSYTGGLEQSSAADPEPTSEAEPLTFEYDHYGQSYGAMQPAPVSDANRYSPFTPDNVMSAYDPCYQNQGIEDLSNNLTPVMPSTVEAQLSENEAPQLIQETVAVSTSGYQICGEEHTVNQDPIVGTSVPLGGVGHFPGQSWDDYPSPAVPDYTSQGAPGLAYDQQGYNDWNPPSQEPYYHPVEYPPATDVPIPFVVAPPPPIPFVKDDWGEETYIAPSYEEQMMQKRAAEAPAPPPPRPPDPVPLVKDDWGEEAYVAPSYEEQMMQKKAAEAPAPPPPRPPDPVKAEVEEEEDDGESDAWKEFQKITEKVNLMVKKTQDNLKEIESTTMAKSLPSQPVYEMKSPTPPPPENLMDMQDKQDSSMSTSSSKEWKPISEVLNVEIKKQRELNKPKRPPPPRPGAAPKRPPPPSRPGAPPRTVISSVPSWDDPDATNFYANVPSYSPQSSVTNAVDNQALRMGNDESASFPPPPPPPAMDTAVSYTSDQDLPPPPLPGELEADIRNQNYVNGHADEDSNENANKELQNDLDDFFGSSKAPAPVNQVEGESKDLMEDEKPPPTDHWLDFEAGGLPPSESDFFSKLGDPLEKPKADVDLAFTAPKPIDPFAPIEEETLLMQQSYDPFDVKPVDEIVAEAKKKAETQMSALEVQDDLDFFGTASQADQNGASTSPTTTEGASEANRPAGFEDEFKPPGDDEDEDKGSFVNYVSFWNIIYPSFHRKRR